MKLLINASNLNKGGGLQVANSFLFEIKNITNIEFHIVLSESLDKVINKDDYSNNFKFYTYTLKPTILKAIFGKDKFLDSLINKINPEKVFTIFGPSYWITKKPHLIGYAIPHYIYTDSPFFKKINIITKIKINLKKYLHYYHFKKSNTFFWVETDDVKERLAKFLNINKNKIHVISNTFHPVFGEFKIKEEIDIRNKIFTFITVSALYPHKNLEILNEIVPLLRSMKIKCQFQLTIDQKLFEIFRNNHDYIKNIGPIKIEQCPEIYNKADAMFLPTLLECFSASYPEAMKMKKPILTSDLSFANDICGDSALYFDPQNPVDIVDKIKILINDKNKVDKLVNSGVSRLRLFDTSESRAKKLLNICKSDLLK